MTRAVPKLHWMGDVLQSIDPTLARLTQATPQIDVWKTAQLVSGLSIEQLTKKVAAYFKLEVADLNAADLRILKLVPEKLARRYKVIPTQQDDRHLYVATSEPSNLEAGQAIAFASSRSTVFQLAAPQAIQEAIDRRYSPNTCVFPIALDDLLYRRTSEAHILPAEPTIAFKSGRTAVLQPKAGQATLVATDVWADNGERDVSAAAMEQAHILIVDDDSVTRRLAWSILAKHGYRVVEASDGFEALERVSGKTPLALIVLDLDMPRLGGREVLAKLKSSASTSGIPVIVLTGSGEDADEADLMEKGADDYIRKPLEPARFTARIKGVLRRVNG